MKNSLKLIINCDDFGHSDTINRCTFELISRKKVTSASLITNSPLFESIVPKIKHFKKDVSFGVHLNLTEFQPILKSDKLKPLLDTTGSFQGRVGKKIYPPLLISIFREWSLQIKKAIDAGIPISHLDSHGNIHTMPQLFPIVIKLAHDFGIKWIRPSNKLYFPKIYGSGIEGKITILNSWICNKTLESLGYVHHCYFGPFERFIMEGEKICDKYDVIECNVHPGHQNCKKETMLLDTNWLDIFPAKIKLVSYWEI